MKISEKIKMLRRTEGYTQKELGKILKIGSGNTQNYELGNREPNYATMQKTGKTTP